jgi:AcrR family transcriptional regulator
MSAGAERKPYSSTRRAIAATATREAILDAAQQLFVENGFATTSLSDVAKAAGVALKTIYVSVGGRADLVNALVERGLSAPLSRWDSREIPNQVNDGREFLASLVNRIRVTFEPSLPIIGVMIDASWNDKKIAERTSQTSERYNLVLRETAEVLSRSDLLDDAVNVDRAFDVLFFYLSPAAWQRLRQSGWDWDEIQSWLSDQASRALLRPRK